MPRFKTLDVPLKIILLVFRSKSFRNIDLLFYPDNSIKRVNASHIDN